MKCLTKLSVYLVCVTVSLHGVKAALLEGCTSDAFCTGGGGDQNAVCEEEGAVAENEARNCICIGAYKNNDGDTECVPKVLGDTCDVNSDCMGTDNSYCSTEGNCACEANYIEESEACRKAAVTEITCDAGDDDCTTDNSECDDAENKPMCKCAYGYKEDSNDQSTCVEIPSVTQTPCGDGTEGCTVDHSECDNAQTPMCKCSDGYKEDSNEGITCVKIPVSEIPCESDNDDCKVEHSECDGATTSPKCKCSDGYEEDTTDGSTCVKTAESSATSAWMASSLLVTSMLINLPRFILWYI